MNRKYSARFFIFFLSLVIGSIFISSLNQSNDFIANYELDFSEASENEAVALRGSLFFYSISVLSQFLSAKYVIFFLYSLIPACQLLLFRRLITSNVKICLLMYFGLIYLAQSTYLLKMGISQVFFMLALTSIGFTRQILLPLCILMHTQSLVVLFSYFKFVSRWIYVFILSCFFYLFQSQIIELLSAFDFIAAFGMLNADVDSGLLKINLVSIALILLYLVGSLCKSKATSNNGIMLERIIDASILLAITLASNTVVANRLLDFSWILILLYFGQMKSLSAIPSKVMGLCSIFFIVWGANFTLVSIFNFN